jgi:hypothetical protein
MVEINAAVDIASEAHTHRQQGGRRRRSEGKSGLCLYIYYKMQAIASSGHEQGNRGFISFIARLTI